MARLLQTTVYATVSFLASGSRDYVSHVGQQINQATRTGSQGRLHDAISDLLDQAFVWLGSHVFFNTMRGQDPSTFAGVYTNSEEDGRAMITSIAFNVFVSCLCFVAFIVLLKAKPLVYAYRAVKESKAHITWLPIPYNTISPVTWAVCADCVPDQEVVKIAGLDALMLSKYHFLCCKIMRYLSIVLIGVLCPLTWWVTSTHEEDWLQRLGMGQQWSPVGESNIFRGPWGQSCVVWTYVLCVWYTVCLCVRLTCCAQREFLNLRYVWLQSLPSPQATTLLVQNIPKGYRSDANLHRYFADLFGEDAVQRAYIVRRNTARLRQLVLIAEACDKQSQDPQMLFLQTHIAGFSMSETTSEERRKKAWREVNTERLEVHKRVMQQDSQVVTDVGFVTFTSHSACRLALQEQLRHNAGEFTKSMPPGLDDVKYEGFAAGPRGMWLSRLATGLVFVAWIPVIMAISGLASPSTLRLIPFFDSFFEQHPRWLSYFEGVAATVGMRICLLLLPNALMWLIRACEAGCSGLQEQQALQTRYFHFLVAFVLLVNAISMALYRSLQVVGNDPSKFILLLADSLPSVSHFYSNYMMFGTTCLILCLLRVPVLLRYAVHRLLLGEGEHAAQQAASKEEEDSDGAGARMAAASLMMAIALVFCTCMPLILLSSLLYFYVGGYIYRYLPIYAEARKCDLGGGFWVTGLKHIFEALFLYVALMAGVLYEQASLASAVAAAMSLGVVAYGYVCFERLVWTTLPFEAVAAIDKEQVGERMPEEGEHRQYVQSECVPGNIDEMDEGEEELAGETCGGGAVSPRPSAALAEGCPEPDPMP